MSKFDDERATRQEAKLVSEEKIYTLEKPAEVCVKQASPVERLADAHWEYVKGLLELYCKDAKIMESTEYHYKTAFIHGYKHGQEEYIKQNKACTNNPWKELFRKPIDTDTNFIDEP